MQMDFAEYREPRQVVQCDLDATGLSGFEVGLAVTGSGWDEEPIVAGGFRPDGFSPDAEQIDMSLPATSAEVLSQIAVSLQSSLVDIEHIQWPVCRFHDRLLNATTNETGAAWICRAPQEHAVALIGGLGRVAHQLRS